MKIGEHIKYVRNQGGGRSRGRLDKGGRRSRVPKGMRNRRRYNGLGPARVRE